MPGGAGQTPGPSAVPLAVGTMVRRAYACVALWYQHSYRFVTRRRQIRLKLPCRSGMALPLLRIVIRRKIYIVRRVCIALIACSDVAFSRFDCPFWTNDELHRLPADRLAMLSTALRTRRLDAPPAYPITYVRLLYVPSNKLIMPVRYLCNRLPSARLCGGIVS